MAKIDFNGYPKHSIEELDRMYPPDLLLIIEDVLATKKNFVAIFQDLIDIMKY